MSVFGFIRIEKADGKLRLPKIFLPKNQEFVSDFHVRFDLAKRRISFEIKFYLGNRKILHAGSLIGI
jgi:hypothetical protein